MKIVRDKRSNIFKVEFKDAMGERRSKSLKTKDPKVAKTRAKESGIELIEQVAKADILREDIISIVISGKKERLEDALEAYYAALDCDGSAPNTTRKLKDAARQFVVDCDGEGRAYGKYLVSQIEERHICEHLLNRYSTRATRAAMHSGLRRFFEFLAHSGRRRGNPAKQLKKTPVVGLSHEQKESKKVVAVTPEDYETFMRKTQGAERWKTFIRQAVGIAYWTGMRLGDICNLEWSSIDKRYITVWTMKRDTRIRLDMEDPLVGGKRHELRRLINDILPIDPQYVFPDERAEYQKDPSAAKFSTYTKRLFIECGIEGKTFHGLRHAFAKRWRESGRPEEDIAGVLGHKSIATTSRYGNH